MCGGTLPGQIGAAAPHGLSPRVRGNRRLRPRRRTLLGSIPACAGEPVWTRKPPQIRAVYPRVCGGTYSPFCPLRAPGGLSPRVRGNLLHLQQQVARAGSIPACAGEPRWRSRRRPGNGVYPRVCGGTRLSPHAAPFGRGLSPRVRGNRNRPQPAGLGLGSIPACAGEPRSLVMLTGVSGVYPRVCGGTSKGSQIGDIWAGLSPRVRGNH